MSFLSKEALKELDSTKETYFRESFEVRNNTVAMLMSSPLLFFAIYIQDFALIILSSLAITCFIVIRELTIRKRFVTAHMVKMIFFPLLMLLSPFWIGLINTFPLGFLGFIYVNNYFLPNGRIKNLLTFFILICSGIYVYFINFQLFPQAPYSFWLDMFMVIITFTYVLLADSSAKEEIEVLKKNLLGTKGYLDKIISLHPGFIFPEDSNQMFRVVNHQFQSKTGYTEEELLKTPVKDIIIPVDPPKVMEDLEALRLNQLKGIEFESKFQRKDGTTGYGIFRINSIVDLEGNHIEFIGSFTDMSTQKEVQAIIEQKSMVLDGLLTNFPTIYYSFDKDGIFIESFGSGLEKLGLQPNEVAGQSLFELYSFSTPVIEAHKKTLSGENAEYTAEIPTPNGNIYWDSRVFYDPKTQGGFGFAFDVTRRKEIELALQESEERFRRFFENSPFGIAFRKVKEDVYAWANPKAIEMLGYTPHEFVHMNRSRFIQSENTAELKSKIQEIANGKMPMHHAEKQFKRKDGSTFWARVTRFVFSFKNEQYVAGIIEDIQEQRLADEALKQSEERYRLLANNSTDLICLHDPSGKYIYVSPSIYNLAGYTVEELIGQSPYNFFHPEDQEKIRSGSHNKALNGQTAYERYRYRTKVNSYIWLETLTNPIYNEAGEIEYILTASRDISFQKKAEDTLKRQAQELSRKNEELEKYIESNLQLENFAYMASHDLREPLRTIVSFSQLLERKLSVSLGDSEKEYLQFIIKATRNMESLINDLLTFSRVNTDEHINEHINMDRFLKIIYNEMQTYIEEKQANIIIQNMPETVYGSRTKLRQLFQNIIANGIKFHKSGVDPEIVIEGQEHQKYWEFSIKDNGIGIAPEFHEKIFLLFRKLHNKNHYEGTGIGLALCKKIVQQHNGKIWLDSEEGEGTRFHFTLEKPSLS